MTRQTLNKRRVNGLFSLVLGFCVLVLSVPCNCMADRPLKSSDSKSPCHSSQDHSSQHHSSHHSSQDSQNKQNQEDNSTCPGTCCCNINLNLVSSDLTPAGTLPQDDNLQDKPIKLLSHQFITSDIFSSIYLTGESPPGGELISLHNKNYLALIQRWIIWHPPLKIR
jgi:hypothetical protein